MGLGTVKVTIGDKVKTLTNLHCMPHNQKCIFSESQGKKDGRPTSMTESGVFTSSGEQIGYTVEGRRITSFGIPCHQDQIFSISRNTGKAFSLKTINKLSAG